MISIIAGMTKNRVIGKNNQLPWHIPEDLQNFKKITNGKTVLMGRKTYESLPAKFRPLPNRKNIVISRTMLPEAGLDVCKSMEEAVERANAAKEEFFVIGGASIYQQALPFADKLYISYIKSKEGKEYEGDTYFPEFDLNDWEEELREDHDEFEFVVYRRNNKQK